MCLLDIYFLMSGQHCKTDPSKVPLRLQSPTISVPTLSGHLLSSKVLKSPLTLFFHVHPISDFIVNPLAPPSRCTQNPALSHHPSSPSAPAPMTVVDSHVVFCLYLCSFTDISHRVIVQKPVKSYHSLLTMCHLIQSKHSGP